jgi:ferritin-like metal-binding protein YciE
MAELQELLTDHLRDLYDAEKQLTKALPRLAKAASNEELKRAFTEHTEITKNQVTRIEQAFEHLGEKAKSKPCKGMKGLVEEGQEHVGEHGRGLELDLALAAAAEKVEHYEIASYMTARSMAKTIGQRAVAGLMQETLREEEQTGNLMLQIAERLQREMQEMSGREEEEETDSRSSGRGAASGGSRGKQAVSKRGQSQSASSRGAQGSASSRGGSKSAASKSGGSQSHRSSEGSGRGSAGSTVSTDHEQIRQWAEERGAKPACVRGTGGKGDTGMIRLDFPGYSGRESLEEISWDDWFDKFDEQGLALLHQEKTSGGQKSNFNKLIAREGSPRRSSGSGGSSRGAKKGAKRSR